MPYFDNIRPNLAGDRPQIHPDALIDPSAQVIGNVVVGKDVFIGPLAVVRADERGPDGSVKPIVIGDEVNLQDGVIIHTHGGASVTIGARTSVAHGVAIHGPCSIGEDCFLAMRCTVYSATLESNVWIGMSAIIMRATLEHNTYVPAGSVIRSHRDISGRRIVTDLEQEYMREVLDAANRLRRDYMEQRARAEEYLKSRTLAKPA